MFFFIFFSKTENTGQSICNFICLFLAALCLHCCMGFSLVGASWGCSLVAVHRLVLAVAALAGSTGSRHTGFSSFISQALEHRFSGCGSQVQSLCGVWDLPGSQTELVSPALARSFSTTTAIREAPGQSIYMESTR